MSKPPPNHSGTATTWEVVGVGVIGCRLVTLGEARHLNRGWDRSTRLLIKALQEADGWCPLRQLPGLGRVCNAPTTCHAGGALVPYSRTDLTHQRTPVILAYPVPRPAAPGRQLKIKQPVDEHALVTHVYPLTVWYQALRLRKSFALVGRPQKVV